MSNKDDGSENLPMWLNFSPGKQSLEQRSPNFLSLGISFESCHKVVGKMAATGDGANHKAPGSKVMYKSYSSSSPFQVEDLLNSKPFKTNILFKNIFLHMQFTFDQTTKMKN